MMAYLKHDHTDKTFTRGALETEVLKDIRLGIEKGELDSIIGHSGCGKTTLLNIVAGLTRAHLQDSVMAIHQKLRNTVLMITHDVDEAVLLSDRIVMMTNGPAARIGEVLDVPLARPRWRLDVASSPTYLKCRQRVLEFLYERHRFIEAA